ncbi:18798_t:CDS:2 [Funneliformis geosporum]|nr:18798_t:CDS:2 [Funneliformis geosporum]
MHLQDFYLEVLVNGNPLPEYNLPVDESDQLNSTCVSYVTDPLTQTKTCSNFTTYIPVITPGERYTIRAEAKQASPSNIIISRLYIDGQFDQVQLLHQHQSSRIRSYFINHERNKVYFFKFASTSQFDKKDDGVFKVPFPVKKHPNKQSQIIYGKPGIVTVCFFKGIIVDESALQNKPEFEVKQVKIKETIDNNNKDIDFTTSFDAMDAKIQPSIVTKIVNLNPIAVLHLHYRSVDWLTNRGFSLPILCTDKVKKEEIVNSNTNEDENSFANDFQEIIVEPIDEFSKEMPINMIIENNNAEPTKIILEKSQEILDINVVEQMNEDNNIKHANNIDKTLKPTKDIMEIENNIEETNKILKESQEIMEIGNNRISGNHGN